MVYIEQNEVFSYSYSLAIGFFDTFDIYRDELYRSSIIGQKNDTYYYLDTDSMTHPVIFDENVLFDIMRYPKNCIMLTYENKNIDFDDVRLFVGNRYCFYKCGVSVYNDCKSVIDNFLGYDLLTSDDYRKSGHLEVLKVDNMKPLYSVYFKSVSFAKHNKYGSWVLPTESCVEETYTSRKAKRGNVDFSDGKFISSKTGKYCFDDVNRLLSTMSKEVEITLDGDTLVLKDRLGTARLNPAFVKTPSAQ